MVKIKHLFKTLFIYLFKIINKEYLIEYWVLIKNEPALLTDIGYFYVDFIKPGMKVIDVGGNTGNYSRVFLNLGAKVIAVEPQTYCQKILNARFKNQTNFKLITAALGPKESMAVIHKSNSHTIASMNANWITHVKNSNRFPDENWNRTEHVQVTTLDKVIKDNFMPDYIKIDVEGFESEVLKGLSCSINYISFEITLPEMIQSAKECVQELERIGKYLYVIPTQNKFTQLNDWKTKAEIFMELETLANNGIPVSTDMFAKAIYQ